MANELNLYSAFKAILDKSRVIEGRFHVASGYGADLNTNGLAAVFTEAISEVKSPKKYPLAVMMPPVEVVGGWDKGWSRFKIKMFFVTPPYSNAGQILSRNDNTNTSGHPVSYTWKDMRECAGDFRVAIEEALRAKGCLNLIRPVDGPEIIERFSKVGNDMVSGVSISFDMEVFMPCNLKDYQGVEFGSINLDLSDIHPLHKH